MNRGRYFLSKNDFWNLRIDKLYKKIIASRFLTLYRAGGYCNIMYTVATTRFWKCKWYASEDEKDAE